MGFFEMDGSIATTHVSSAGPSAPISRSGLPQELVTNWHLFLFAAATGLAMATANECQSVTHLPSLLYGVVLWVWWAILATALWAMSQRRATVLGFARGTVALHTLAAALLGGAHLYLLWATGFLVGWDHNSKRMMWDYLMNINRFGIEILIYAFVLTSTNMLQARLHAQSEAIRTLSLERQLSAAQLQALQMQLEPHFLFNTLNAITSLVDLGRREQAVAMLSHLNSILKTSLQRGTPEKVTLAQELELVENYLAIEQVRFADRLRFDLYIKPGVLDALVPCFLLQPIIENAIRHGAACCEEVSRIKASATRDGACLTIRIYNTGAGSVSQVPLSGHGIGLTNTRERLAYFYPQQHVMRAHALGDGGFETLIQIPYEPHRG